MAKKPGKCLKNHLPSAATIRSRVTFDQRAVLGKTIGSGD